MKLRSVIRSAVLIMLIAVIAVLAAERAAWASPAEYGKQPPHSTVPKKEADLSISKSAHQEGNTFVFSITVSNAGPVAAEDVRVTDSLSGHFAFISVSGPNCRGGQTVTCRVGTLGVGKSASITISVRVKDNFHGTITNTASVSSKTKDPNHDNNKASAKVIVGGQPITDVSISKKAREAGDDDFIFTITVKNNSKAAAENVVVSDQLSNRFELQYVKGANCNGDQHIVCSLGTLGAGKSVTIEIRVDVNQYNYRGSIYNTANVTTSTSETDYKNNSSTVKVNAKGHH